MKADDVAGLVERLRHAQNDLSAYSVRAKRGLFKDAASALESLTARVAELEAAVDAEREACARACEAEHISRRLIDDHKAYNSALRNAAAAIRQRAGRG
jgi:hypothetical protein